MRFLLPLLTVFFITCSKSKENTQPLPCELYTKGYMQAVIRDSVSIGEVFNYLDKLNGPPHVISGYQYLAPPNTDSMQLRQLLDSKSYLNDQDDPVAVYWDSASSRWYLRFNILDKNQEDQQDFLHLRDSLHIELVPVKVKQVIFHFEEGQERYWYNKLLDGEIFSGVSPMCWVF